LSGESAWRIAGLEREIAELKQWQKDELAERDAVISSLTHKVQELVTMRDQWVGMGKLARFGVKAVILLGGYGLWNLLWKIFQWMNAPMVRPHIG